MGEFSVTHLLLLALVFLIFFGPSRLPQLGQSLGKAIRGFKQGLNDIETDAKDIQETAQQVKAPQAAPATAPTAQTAMATETVQPTQTHA